MGPIHQDVLLAPDKLAAGRDDERAVLAIACSRARAASVRGGRLGGARGGGVRVRSSQSGLAWLLMSLGSVGG
jgi:hypothetical protein